MPDAPFFSIIIPTYNREGFIRKAIQSCLDQTFHSFEVLVVDDGSTDNTAAAVASLKDVRIKYFWKENGERAAARNYGIERSEGKYITFLDSDDFLKSSHLTQASEFISRNNAGVVALGYDVVTPEGSVLYPWKALPDPANKKLMEGNFLSCSGVFVQRDILLANAFNEDRALSGSEDYELWLRLAARYSIRVANSATACLVQHGERSVVNFTAEQLLTRLERFEKYLMADSVFVNRERISINRTFGFQRLYIALHLVMAGYKLLGLQQWLRAVVKFPAVVLNARAWVVIHKTLI